jgi:hypothetical protein
MESRVSREPMKDLDRLQRRQRGGDRRQQAVDERSGYAHGQVLTVTTSVQMREQPKGGRPRDSTTGLPESTTRPRGRDR